MRGHRAGSPFAFKEVEDPSGSFPVADLFNYPLLRSNVPLPLAVVQPPFVEEMERNITSDAVCQNALRRG